LQARALLLQSLGVDAPCPEAMIGSMASIPLPAAAAGSPAFALDCGGLHAWLRQRDVEAWLHPHPVPLLRISAQLYNDLGQYQELAGLLVEALGDR
jgi:isopenicillin-N epimerase